MEKHQSFFITNRRDLFPKQFIYRSKLFAAGLLWTLCLFAVGCEESTGSGRGSGTVSLQPDRRVTTPPPTKIMEIPEWQKDIIIKMETMRVSFDFDETPLSDVVAMLRKRTGFNIIVWPTVDENQVVTLKLNNMKLQNAVDWIMRTQGLEYRMMDEALVIARKTDIRSEPVMKVYDVRDLGYKPPDFVGPDMVGGDGVGVEVDNNNDGESSAEVLKKVIESIVETAEKAAEEQKNAAPAKR